MINDSEPVYENIPQETKEPDKKYEKIALRAQSAYRKSDVNRWVCALWCSQVVGTYTSGSKKLAQDLSVEPDTVEDMAHAYSLYRELCELPDARKFVAAARKLPYVYISHFRALWDARRAFGLDNSRVLALLLDIVMAEGDISSRGLDEHIRKRYGLERDWTYYAQKANKALMKSLSDPKLKKRERRRLQSMVNWIGENA